MWRDEAYLLDILIAARKVLQFTKGVNQQQFRGDEIIQNAVMRQLEIIGEATRRISDETRRAYSQVPWQDILGMRNRLIHDYTNIDVDEVWDTAVRDVPQLVSLLENLLPS